MRDHQLTGNDILKVYTNLFKFIESFDFDELVASDSRDLANSLQESAKAGNVFAKNILDAAGSIEDANLQQRAAALIQSGDPIKAAAGRSAALVVRESGKTFMESGGDRESRMRQLRENNPDMSEADLKIANQLLAQELKARDRAVKQTLIEARQRGIVNKALKDTGEE